MSIEVDGFRGALLEILTQHLENECIDKHDLADDVCTLFDKVINYVSEELDNNPENFVAVDDDREFVSKGIEFGLYKLKRLSGEEETLCLNRDYTGTNARSTYTNLSVFPSHNKKYHYCCNVGYMTHTITLNAKERVIYELADGNIDVSKNLIRYVS